MFVAMTIFRRWLGANTRACSALESRPNSGTSSCCCPNERNLPSSRSLASRMSRSLGMNTRMSPDRLSRTMRSTASTAPSM